MAEKPHGPNNTLAVSASSDPVVALADTDTATTYIVGTVIDVRVWRRITMIIKAHYDAASDQPTFNPLLAFTASQPAAADDSWYGYPTGEAAPTATVVTGTIPTDADYTFTPEWGRHVNYMRQDTIPAGDNATDEHRIVLRYDVSDARWFQMSVGAIDAGCNVEISYVLSC